MSRFVLRRRQQNAAAVAVGRHSRSSRGDEDRLRGPDDRSSVDVDFQPQLRVNALFRTMPTSPADGLERADEIVEVAAAPPDPPPPP